VVIVSGKVDSPKTEKISPEEYEEGWRQACKTTVLSDCTVRIPEESRGPRGQVVKGLDMGEVERKVASLETRPLAVGWELDPTAIKVMLNLNGPTAQDNVSDLTRLLVGLRQQHGIEDVSTDIHCLKAMPEILRNSDWSITVTLATDPSRDGALSCKEGPCPWKLVRLEGGDTSRQNLAVALDLGTTTICGQLVDLSTGEVLAEKAEYNGQISCGADVITRIVFAQKPGGSEKLQSLAVASINHLVDGLLEDAQKTRNSISCMAVSGNTTMTHLLLGMETRYLREAPYVPAASSMFLVEAGELGIDLPDCVNLYTFPSVASYVGGDIVSGILGSGVFQKEDLTLYMDIGTNGEIALGNRDWLACAACSMGPAFEGGGIKHGMQADLGAIEGFHVNPLTLEPMVVTLGRTKPIGICGSGLISILSELLSACVIDRNGKFVQDLSSDRIRPGQYGCEYVLAWAEDSGTGADIVITEVDMENLIRAKGALFAGCLTLLESLSLSFDVLDRVIIAGAFGRYINLDKGKRIGLFPDIPNEKFHFLGNGSLLGSRLVSLSKGMFSEVKRIAQMMTNIELSDNQSFMDKYVGALFLPHTESRLFPKVSQYLEANSQVIGKERDLL
jgi:uncharacterized 2Fe-2S/4Fe-4S cluster protein (DUF4445 family)